MRDEILKKHNEAGAFVSPNTFYIFQFVFRLPSRFAVRGGEREAGCDINKNLFERKKIMKTMKKIVPALCLLLITAALMGTSTYAWFSMNTTVTATGMQVKAQAEGGIVISNESQQDWKASATASHNSVAELIPVSTATTAAWVHAMSDDANDAKPNQTAAGAYTPLTVTVNNGIGSATVGAETKNVYLVNSFYIKSSAEQVTLAGDKKLLINDVTATGNSTSSDLDQALRVAVVIGGQTYIFAPLETATTGNQISYKYNNTTSVSANDSTVKNVKTTIVDIPANGCNANQLIKADVYVYFEGEDVNCKSNNITATLDTLQINVRFGTVEVAA